MVGFLAPDSGTGWDTRRNRRDACAPQQLLGYQRTKNKEPLNLPPSPLFCVFSVLCGQFLPRKGEPRFPRITRIPGTGTVFGAAPKTTRGARVLPLGALSLKITRKSPGRSTLFPHFPISPFLNFPMSLNSPTAILPTIPPIQGKRAGWLSGEGCQLAQRSAHDTVLLQAGGKPLLVWNGH